MVKNITEHLNIIRVFPTTKEYEELYNLDIKDRDLKELKDYGFDSFKLFLMTLELWQRDFIYNIYYKNNLVGCIGVSKADDGGFLTFTTVELERLHKYLLFRRSPEILKYVMREADIDNVTGYISDWYKASIKMAEDLGFRYDSTRVVRGSNLIPYTFKKEI